MSLARVVRENERLKRQTAKLITTLRQMSSRGLVWSKILERDVRSVRVYTS